MLPKTAQFPTPQHFGKTTFTYYEGTERISSVAAVNFASKADTFTADIDVPAAGANGVIFLQGGRYGGTTLYVKDNRVIYEINAYGNRSGQVVASDPLPSGKSHIVVELTPESAKGQESHGDDHPKYLPATATLTIDNKAEGTGHFLNVNVHTNETLDVGSDLGSSLSPEYQSPNRFTGKIYAVTIQLKR